MTSSLLIKISIIIDLISLIIFAALLILLMLKRLPKSLRPLLERDDTGKHFKVFLISMVSIFLIFIITIISRERLNINGIGCPLTFRILLVGVPVTILFMNFSTLFDKKRTISIISTVIVGLLIIVSEGLDYSGVDINEYRGFITVSLYMSIFLFFLVRILYGHEEIRKASNHNLETIYVTIIILVFILLIHLVGYVKIDSLRIILSVLIVMGYFVIALNRVFRGTFFLRKRETDHLNILKPLYLYDGKSEGYDRSDPLNGIKDRLIIYFNEKKPYLLHNLKIEDVALAIITNKTYLSRTLNNKMDVNFNQFVNYYRVKEAMTQFIENQELSINDMCVKSGFKNMASFIHAFRLYTGYTPSEWCKEIKYKYGRGEKMKYEISWGK